MKSLWPDTLTFPQASWARDPALRLKSEPVVPRDRLMELKVEHMMDGLDLSIREIARMIMPFITREEHIPAYVRTWFLNEASRLDEAMFNYANTGGAVGFVNGVPMALDAGTANYNCAMVEGQNPGYDAPLPREYEPINIERLREVPATYWYWTCAIPIAHRDESVKSREKAKATALAFLLDHLSIDERMELLEKRYFTVTGSEGGTYRLSMLGTTERLGRDGKVSDSFCLHWNTPVQWAEAMRVEAEFPPEEDLVLAKKLMIETDEPEFLRIANRNARLGSTDSELNGFVDVVIAMQTSPKSEREAWRAVFIRTMKGLIGALARNARLRAQMYGPVPANAYVNVNIEAA